MTGSQSKTVALVDWTWTGHHPTYFKFYTSALAEVGACVVPFLPHADELPALLSSTPVARSPSAIGRISPPNRFTAGRRLPLRPRWLQRLQQQTFHFGNLQRVLRRWERRNGRTIDLVFFACIYEYDFDQFRRAAPLFGWDWAGLHLHATAGRSEPSGGWLDPLKSPRLRALGVLDPAVIPELRRKTGGKPIIVFPDLVDADVPGDVDPEAGLARKLRAFAGPRKIVCLLGHLKLVKGLEAFTRAAADPRLRDVVFFLGGEVGWDGTAKATRNELMHAWERLPNIYTHLQRLDERPFNAVLDASDIVYAAYVDFPFSSNVLTKAALFNKPIIVSDGHLMAERVGAYKLGRVVPQRDATAVADAIVSLLAEDPSQRPSRSADYAALHSYERLKLAFAEILA